MAYLSMAWWWRGNPYNVRKERGWASGEEPEWWQEWLREHVAKQARYREKRRQDRMVIGAYNVKRPRAATRIPAGQHDQLLYRWSQTLRRSVSPRDRLTVTALYYGSLRGWAKRQGEDLRVGERQMSAWLKAHGYAWARTRDGTCFVGLLLAKPDISPVAASSARGK